MGSWITTRQHLHHQDAKSSPTRSQASGELGLPTDMWILNQSRHASLPGSKCIHFNNGQRPHRGYSRILSPQLSNPQLSSTDRLLMAAKDMMDASQNPHPAIPFACVGDDTITALADLATIFKLKLRHNPSPETRASPAKVAPLPSLIPSPHQILNSPSPSWRQTISQTTIHTQNIPDVPLPPRVVTPQSLRASPPMVLTGSQRLSPRNLSQDDFCGMDPAHMAIDLEHCSQRQQANAVIHPVTGKEME
jgi:hypothetical protein